MKTSIAKTKKKFSRNENVFLDFRKKIMETPEPFPIKKFRKTAWNKMGKVSWSSLDREDWRYTKYDQFFPDDFTRTAQSLAEDTPSALSITGLTDNDIRSGVKAVQYSEQMDEVIPFIQNIEQISYSRDKWTFLNEALFNRGLFISIPKDYKVEGTLYIQHVFADDGMEFPLTYVKLNEGSELNLIEEYRGQETDSKSIKRRGAAAKRACPELVEGSCRSGEQTEKTFPKNKFLQRNSVFSNTIIDLAANSKLNQAFIQNLSQESKGLFYQNAFLGKGAEFQTHSVQLGSKLGRVIQNIEFCDSGGYLKNYGLVYGSKRQHLDIETNQIHKASYTGGELLYRHVLTDRARSVFKGKIVIEKDKMFCNASQKNENLLLSSKAEAISLPKLEISNNEVQCGHGVAISSIDEDQLFYLTSRGIGMDDARKMIVEGFFDEVIKKSSNQDIAEIISKKVKEVL